DFRGVGQLFANPEHGYAVRLHGLVEGMLASDGMVETRREGLNARIERLNEQREVLGERLAALEARLLQKVNALDTLLGQLSATSNYLAQQLANLRVFTARQRD